jgi:hypothetical protein
MRESLHMIARCRFGEVPGAIVERINTAPPEEVERMMLDLLATRFKA